MQLFDSHVHLSAEQFQGELEALLQRAAEAGVATMLSVGYDLPASRSAVQLAKEWPQLYAAVGCHPQDAAAYDAAWEEELCRLLSEPKVVALGEIGLDFYRDRAPRDLQRAVFARQIAIAKERQLPIIIHCREADAEVVAIVRQGGYFHGVMHCFSGDWQLAQECLEMGFYISIAGPVTYPKALTTQEVATNLPLDRLLIETDAPWLAPQKHRGRRNEPAYLRQTAEAIAKLRGIELDVLAEATSANAKRLFGI